ncbi:MAG TPA: copper resistance CopC family protein, partial [Solirubrobacter sp.]|nr:copper resistance CopC family protein [Solirubrobacter sp.]
MRAIAVALAALLLAPAAAFGHATLESTVPARGAKLDRPPPQVVFRFDESVEASFGALRVFDARGREIQDGDAFHPGGEGADIAVKLKSGLGDGTYTATYRVVSADGHVVSSGFVFSVGEAAAPAESLDQLLAAGGHSGRITNSALSVARAVQYGAIALGLGALIFVLLCWRGRSRAFTGRVERLVLVAGIAGVVSALAALILQGAIGEGTSFWSAARPDTVREVLGTRFGTAWGLGALAWLLALATLTLRPLRPERRGGAAPPSAGGPAPAAAARREPTPALAAQREASAALVGAGPALAP